MNNRYMTEIIKNVVLQINYVLLTQLILCARQLPKRSTYNLKWGALSGNLNHPFPPLHVPVTHHPRVSGTQPLDISSWLH